MLFGWAALFCLAVSNAPTLGENPSFQMATLRGRVVFLADALKERFGVETVSEARQHTLAIATVDGQLIPIVEDVRGRAFRRDERLRKMDLELLVRRYVGSPAVQVIGMYELRDDGKYEVDYWCDICAISMLELKPCDCCQGPIELRKRRKDD